MCLFHFKHYKNHHIIDINEKESLEDNGILYKELISEFDEIFQKAKNLNLKIEKEIEKINNSYKKIENEIILSFKKQHLELEEKEKNLKLELDFQVNQIKNELEKNLTISSNILLSCQKTNEIITKYETKINNDIKTLYFISEINKSKEKAKDFVNKKIKNSDIFFESNKLCYFYDDYYFNGIPFPKNIKAEKMENKLSISWDLDNSYIKDINANKIKYLLYIKSTESPFDFRCETKDKFYYYCNYDEKKDYEIKIRTSIDGCQSEWYEIKKSKEENSFSTIIIGNNNKSILFPSLCFSQRKQNDRLFENSFDNKNDNEGLSRRKFDFRNLEEKNNNNINKEKSLINTNPFLKECENSIIGEFDRNTDNNENDNDNKIEAGNDIDKDNNDTDKNNNDINKNNNDIDKDNNDINKNNDDSDKNNNDSDKDNNDSDKNNNSNKNNNDSDKNNNDIDKDKNHSNKDNNDSDKDINDINKNIYLYYGGFFLTYESFRLYYAGFYLF